MAVEFLDETQAAPVGVEFLDVDRGIEFIDRAPASPASADELSRRFLDPFYEPTRAEFDTWRKAEDSKPFLQPSAWPGKIGDAAAAILETVKAGGRALVTDADPALSGLQTVLEGAARGTRRDLQIMRKLLPDELLGRPRISFDQYAASRVAGLNQEAFPQGLSTVTTPLTRNDVPPDMLAQWRKDFDLYNADSAFKEFQGKRAEVREEVAIARGNANVLPEIFGKPQTDVAEVVSLTASPLALVPFGRALTPARTLTRAAMAKTLEGAGKTFEWVGEATTRAATVPERAAGALVRLASGSEEAGTMAAETVARGVAGVSMSPVKAAGRTIAAGGQAARAAGRQAAQGPSRYGLLDRISKDAAAPQWLRRAANAGRALDPAIAGVGIAAQGAADGAVIGGTLGALTDGEEGFTAGVGSGLAIGAPAALAGRAVAGGRYRRGLEDMEVARWLASKSPEEIQNVLNLHLNRDQAVKLADMERLARGVGGGDVEFRYLSDKDFVSMFGVLKGAEILQGDRPVVFVNTHYKPRTVFHEMMHALDDLEGSAGQRAALNRLLVDQTLPDGQVVSKGLFSAEDMAEFTTQYRARLNEANRAEFDLLSLEDRQVKALQELRAESFANLIMGGEARGGLRRRVADALLLAEHSSILGRMRRALQAAGVKFNSSGEPSELFVKNGKPITNSPAVDAALRDYLRAKDNVTRRLAAGDEPDEPSLVVRPQNLLSKGNAGLVRAFQDNDIFAKNPDGTVKMLGGLPVLLTEREIRLVQSKRVEAMIAALHRVPSAGDPDSVGLKPNGAWEGRRFSDSQLAALDALPDDLLSPSMKARVRELNAFATQDGAQVILDYNAALKGGRYSSGIAPTTRAAVPLSFHISKAGNFYMVTLDTTHFVRKLGEWRKTKTKIFEPWTGDVDAFMRDVFTYLDNHVNGRPGSVNLDADPAVAVHKKNVINDFFNVPKGAGNEDLNPVQISTRSNKDNLIRSRRFDRINRVTPGAGDRFPIRYELQKRNYLPADRIVQPADYPESLAQVSRHTSVSGLVNHPLYDNAKHAADGAAAVKVVQAIVKPEVFATLRQQLDPARPVIVVPVIQREAGKRLNALPIAYAARVAHELGGRVWMATGKVSGAPNTGASVQSRLSNKQQFAGRVPRPGSQIVMVDDTFTSGDTLTALIDYLATDNMPVAATSLAAGRYQNWLKPSAAKIQSVLDMGGLNERQFERETGFSIRRLTGSELQQHLLTAPRGIAGIRARFRPGYVSGSAGGRSAGGVGDSQSGEVKFLPASSPVAIHKHLLAQTVANLTAKIAAPEPIAHWLAASYRDALDARLNRGSAATRTEQLRHVEYLAGDTRPDELNHLINVLHARGQDGVKQAIDELVNRKVLLGVLTDTTAEKPSTLAGQVALTASEHSSKAATLVIHGDKMPAIPDGLVKLPVRRGVIIVNPSKADPAQVQRAVDLGRGGHYLGMSTESKPRNGDAVVQTRDGRGRVVQDEVVNEDTVMQAFRASQALAPDGQSALKSPRDVIEERYQ